MQILKILGLENHNLDRLQSFEVGRSKLAELISIHVYTISLMDFSV